jgi:small nuclear ribonucleoprotein G
VEVFADSTLYHWVYSDSNFSDNSSSCLAYCFLAYPEAAAATSSRQWKCQYHLLLAHCQPQYCPWKYRSESSMSLNLSELMVAVKLNANRNVVGVLRGFDQFMNLVLDNTLEVNGNDTTEIGMVVIRGNSVVMIEALEAVR